MLYSLEIYNSQGFSFGVHEHEYMFCGFTAFIICGFIGFKLGYVHEHKFMFCKFTAFITCRKCDFKFGLLYRIF